MMRCPDRRSFPGSGPRPPSRVRAGAVTLELILTLPIWLIALLTIIEFGQILANLQQLSLASRVGAEEASQTYPLPTAGSVPSNVLTAIDQQLFSAGIAPRCKVILEHNLAPGPTTLVSGDCDCSPPDTPLPVHREYVRVTVCAELTALTPNLLGIFGFDVEDCMVQQSTTFRHEIPTGP